VHEQRLCVVLVRFVRVICKNVAVELQQSKKRDNTNVDDKARKHVFIVFNRNSTAMMIILFTHGTRLRICFAPLPS